MSTKEVTDAVAKTTYDHCKPYQALTNFGQIKYAIGCVPMTATSLVDFQCSTALSSSQIPMTADCPFMIKGGWDTPHAKRADEPKYYCYTICQEIRNQNTNTNSSLPSTSASVKPVSASAAPTISHSSAGLSLYPSANLSLIVFIFLLMMMFKRTH
jgi:hypothetical protein